ncbi:hypothetical protein PSECIP111951_04001 [Pseudoalteromonas holothuriae]|uniref:Integrase catalytic domain-containing protein n=1 Tax=Pseudoalteromonas holothuriae TaxID=2963714 RepID=A0ABM9GNM8_9GAMM|nr:hypothetical protein PSECIP111951_04001 [Pseudoalteromonas sp. CIP111951]
MIIDIFSQKIVGWEVYESESGEYAVELLERSLWAEKCIKKDVVLHSNNGSPMKCLLMQTKMIDMGVIGSRRRPVSVMTTRTHNRCFAQLNTVTAGQSKALKARKM